MQDHELRTHRKVSRDLWLGNLALTVTAVVFTTVLGLSLWHALQTPLTAIATILSPGFQR
jgi:hypothetical protein